MYFVPELLLARKRGKFAKCWLAAKLSRANFLRKYNRDTVLRIDVTNTCDELIPHIVGTNASLRFSLSLSADLMIGMVKIHCYQIDVILQRSLEFRTNIKYVYIDEDDSKNRKKKGRKQLPSSEEMFLLPPAEIAITETDFMGNSANEADITLKELGGRSHALEATMQAADQLNFGALTGEQMDQLLQSGGLCFSSPSTARAFPGPALPSDLPLPEIESTAVSRIFKLPETPRGRKTSRNGAGTVERAAQRNQSLDTIQITEVPLEEFEAPIVTDVIPPPGTPTKHKLLSENEVTASPKKRRCLQTEFDSDSTERPIPVASPIIAPAGTAVPFDDDMNFGPLEESLIAGTIEQPRKSRKKKIFADENTQLLVEELRLGMDNLFFKTRTSTASADRAKRTIMSAEELLTVPSTSQSWGKPLLLNYQMIILEPISQTLPVDSGFGVMDPIREPDSSTGERSGELSGEVIGKPGTSVSEISSKDHSKTLEVIPIGGTSTPRVEIHHPIQEETYLPERDIPPKIPNYFSAVEEPPQRTPAQRKSLANYPKAIRNIVRDWSENGQTGRDSDDRSAIESGENEKSSAADSIPRTSTGSLSRLESSSSGRSQEILDLLGWLESLWSNCPVVEFKELCPVAVTTKKRASVMFMNLLELNRLKEVKLTQASPFSPIYIQKYSPYF